MSTNPTPGVLKINTDLQYNGARIDAANGRSLFHATQRDPHPAIGQGVSQAEAEANAERLVALWNAAALAATPAKNQQVFDWKHDSVARPLVCHIEYMPEESHGGRHCSASIVVHKAFADSLDICELLSPTQIKLIEFEALASIERDNAEAAAESRARRHDVLEAA